MRPLDVFAAWFKTAFLGSLFFAITIPFYLFVFHPTLSADEIVVAPPMVFLMTIVPGLLFFIPYIVFMSIYVYRMYDSGMGQRRIYRNIMLAHLLLSLSSFAFLGAVIVAIEKPVELVVLSAIVYTAIGTWVLHHRIKKAIH